MVVRSQSCTCGITAIQLAYSSVRSILHAHSKPGCTVNLLTTSSCTCSGTRPQPEKCRAAQVKFSEQLFLFITVTSLSKFCLALQSYTALQGADMLSICSLSKFIYLQLHCCRLLGSMQHDKQHAISCFSTAHASLQVTPCCFYQDSELSSI